jgi:zinc resistance-associated protein
MSKKNITTSALAVALVLSMAAFAVAGPGYGRGCGGPGYGPNSAYVPLTPDQQAAADQIIEKYDAQFDELRDQMWTKHSVLQAMINGGNADEKKIGKLTSDISSLRKQMWDMRNAMSAELVKAGVPAGRGLGNCPGYGRFSGDDDGPGCGRGMGQGRGNGQGYGPGMMN